MKRAVSLLIFLFLIFGTLQVAESKCKGKKEIKKANKLYFEKKYDEALDHYLKAHEKGCQDGVTQYKMFYCCMKLGDKEQEEQFLKNALSSLEKETEAKSTIETHFYLANAYFSSNSKKLGIEASKRAIEKYERGKFGNLKKSLTLFQMGKIYLDGGQKEKAWQLYRESYERSRKKNDLPDAYLRMILGEIAFADYDAKEFKKASEELTRLIEINSEVIERGSKYRHIYFYLAISSINIGQYEKAEKAWKKVIELGLPYSEEAQYNHRIARAALEESSVWSDIEIIPADHQAKELMKDEDKFLRFKHDFFVRKYKEMDNKKLEEAIVELSRKAKDLKKQAALKSEEKKPQEVMDKERINKNLKELRRSFIFACVEYIGRVLLIRESAIKNGFAVQVMRRDAWEVH